MAVLISQNKNLAAGGKRRAFSKSGERVRARFFLFGLWLALFGAGLNAASGQAVSREYSIKAVFLLNFAQFTDWPTNAFDTPDSPFVIGVLGADPFGTMLDEAVQNEEVNGRKFVVQHFARVADVKKCHILFISQSETRRLDAIVTALQDRPILTVSDIENAAYRGACVRFITENNKIRLHINTDSLKLAGLTMSSKLLRVAELIPAPAK